MTATTPALRRLIATAFISLPILAGCGGDNDDDNDQATNDGGTQVPASESFPVQIGDIGPIAEDNLRQQPFGCQTYQTALGQPSIDNQDGVGYPVTDEGGPAPGDHGAIDPADIDGYSADCGAPTMVQYWYRSTGGGGLQPLEDPQNPPADLATVDINGQTVDYIVRQELGTINRFIYSIFMIEPDPGSDPAEPDLSAWNNKLVYHFGGGVGVGHSQSNGFINSYVDQPDGRGLNVPILEAGYAVVSSTGTGTNTSYNLQLMGETATMVKHQFVTAYGEPDYTFGVGGSGGAIQQLIYEQNHPDLLDGLVPVENYGDMITQINPVGDCELLEHYFDVVDAQVNGTGSVNPKWTDWENRQLIEGLNAINGAETDWDDGSGSPVGSSADPGTTECIEGWRGLSALTMNPNFVDGDTYEMMRQTQPAVFANTRFSYFEDLKHIFGTDPATGFARLTYDNVGVQYGLQALKNGDISVDEFLLLNAHVGGWKKPYQMEEEGYPYSGDPADGLDPWSSRNATAQDHMTPGDVAPRTRGDIEAMRAAWEHGLVYRGGIEDPMILIDNYLEPELDMHHSREKFEIRERMLAHDGDASNLVLWTLDGDADEPLAALLLEAFGLLEQWNDDGMKPVAAADACFEANGDEIARGPDVWDGILTETPDDDGACATPQFEIFGSPRTVAGESLRGWVFKCHTKPVQTALTDGTYDGVTFTPDQVDRLVEIFGETGVCDYSLGDAARPSGL
ncbi:hypothetical protein H0Z60_06500 [Ectothiorhodospiraceae bacterium WFHF3C12]|nr:hypothetical protein [Ectothiorhodospiraceae bacterium WFHF3C12]